MALESVVSSGDLLRSGELSNSEVVSLSEAGLQVISGAVNLGELVERGHQLFSESALIQFDQPQTQHLPYFQCVDEQGEPTKIKSPRIQEVSTRLLKYKRASSFNGSTGQQQKPTPKHEALLKEVPQKNIIKRIISAPWGVVADNIFKGSAYKKSHCAALQLGADLSELKEHNLRVAFTYGAKVRLTELGNPAFAEIVKSKIRAKSCPQRLKKMFELENKKPVVYRKFGFSPQQTSDLSPVRTSISVDNLP